MIEKFRNAKTDQPWFSFEIETSANMTSLAKLILRPAAISIVAALAVYGCGSGGGGSSSVGSGLSGGGGGGGGIVVAGGIANSPIDNAPLKATCADGTAGGTGVSTKGTYSMIVSCDSANFPVVISVDDAKIDNNNPPMMAGADMQFCTAAETLAGTCDDAPYKVGERAPLKVAVPSIAEASNVVNMNAVTTLAAQPIEDKINAFKVAPTTAGKPTPADVQIAETAIQRALGVPSVRNADPVRDAQVARVNSQVLDAVAVTKQLAGATVNPDDVMKAVATAATTAGGQSLTKTESDGSNSFDIGTAQAALTAAAAAITGTDAASVARKAAVTAVNTSLTDTKAVEASIKSKGNAVEQVVRVIAGIPSVQAFDPLKNTLATGTIPADIKAALADTTKADNKAAKTATITAAVATQAISQAITKAQEIDADTTIASVEKANRKKAVFAAAEWIRAGVVKDVTTGVASTASTTGQQAKALVSAGVARDVTTNAASTALTTDQQAQAMAQVAMAVKVAGDQIKTASFANIIDTTTNLPKPIVTGLAEKISSDVAIQIAAKTAADLGDINKIDSTAVMGANAVNTIETAAHNVLTALADFTPPPNVDRAVVQVAVYAVIDSMGATVDPTVAAVKTNIQNTITSIANSLNSALSQQVTVGGATGTLRSLSEDDQVKLMAQAAQTMLGTSPLDFSFPPTLGSVTTAITDAVTVVNSVITTNEVPSMDSPTLEPTTLADGSATLNLESCSAEVKVTNINMGVPIKVTATINGQAPLGGLTAGDAFAPPPSAGGPQLHGSGLTVYIKLSGGGGNIFPNTSGLLVGQVINGQSFALCVVPQDADSTYELTAQIGSRYDFAADVFAADTNVQTIHWTTHEKVASTTATTTTTTSTPTTTTTTTTSTPTTTTTPPATTTTTTLPTTTTTTAASATTTTTASTTTTTLGAAACKLTSGAIAIYVTGAPSCSTSVLGINGLTVTASGSTVPVGVTAVSYSSVTTTCNPFAPPPNPGAELTACKP